MNFLWKNLLKLNFSERFFTFDGLQPLSFLSLISWAISIQAVSRLAILALLFGLSNLTTNPATILGFLKKSYVRWVLGLKCILLEVEVLEASLSVQNIFIFIYFSFIFVCGNDSPKIYPLNCGTFLLFWSKVFVSVTKLLLSAAKLLLSVTKI